MAVLFVMLAAYAFPATPSSFMPPGPVPSSSARQASASALVSVSPPRAADRSASSLGVLVACETAEVSARGDGAVNAIAVQLGDRARAHRSSKRRSQVSSAAVGSTADAPTASTSASGCTLDGALFAAMFFAR